MTLDISKIAYYSGYPVDKIVQQDTVSYTVGAGTPMDAPPYPSALQSVGNNYGQKAFIAAAWSIDGVNFNSTLSSLYYQSASFHEFIPQASVNCGTTTSLVYFYIVNNYTSSLTFTINYALYSIT